MVGGRQPRRNVPSEVRALLIKADQEVTRPWEASFESDRDHPVTCREPFYSEADPASPIFSRGKHIAECILLRAIRPATMAKSE